jgi:hypothetical protein
MGWLGDRVWQMGVGAVLVVAGVCVVYVAAVGEPPRRPAMWIGVVLFITGLLIPLLARAFEATQETTGAEGET